MKWEISNPHDAATIDGEMWAVAAAVIFFGGGQYGVRSDAESESFGPFLFGSTDGVREDYAQKFGLSSADALKKPEVRAALRTVSIAGERTSMTDLVGLAQAAADRLDAFYGKAVAS